MKGVRTVQKGIYEEKEICHKGLCVCICFILRTREEIITVALKRLQIIRDCWKNHKAVRTKN